MSPYLSAYLSNYHALTIQIATGLPLGLLAGLAHFSTLRWNVRLLLAGAPAKAIVLQLARLGAMGALFFALARLGPWALLCGAAGLLLARQAVLSRTKARA